MTPPIAILGAGPSGLTLGRILELAGIDYVIFERDASASSAFRRGGTLDLNATSGQLALKEAGLLEQFRSTARYDATVKIVDAKGKVYIATTADDGDMNKPEIDRWALRDLLLGSVPADRVRWGYRVQHVQRDADGSMSIHFENDRVERGFRLVVGADGAWSKARDLLTPAKPQYSGYTSLTMAIKPDNPFHHCAASLAGPGNYLAFGENKHIFVLKLGDGSYYVAAGLRLPEEWIKENAALLEDSVALRQWLLQNHFADWPEFHTDVIKHSDADFRPWPLYGMPSDALPWQTVAGVTLVGDAAHVRYGTPIHPLDKLMTMKHLWLTHKVISPPFVGEGVNSAMHDSLQLAQQIIKHGIGNLDRAVQDYETLMFPRAMDLMGRSSKAGELMFALDAPRGFLKSITGMDFDS